MIAPAEKAVEANGEPPKVAEEEPAEEEEAPTAEEPAAEEPAKEEEKKDEEKTEDEPAAPVVSKPNPISQLLSTCCGLVCKVVGLVKCLVSQVLGLINLVKDKILSLPWACIINLSTMLAIEGGVAYGYWLLTEDQLVFALPVINLTGKFVLGKLGLEAPRAHLATELLDTSKLALKYYIYRTYITASAWDEAELPAMTSSLTDLTDQIPISAEDGKNGALVFVSAVSVLSGVAPIAG